MTIELLGLMDTGKLFDLLDELTALLDRQDLGHLYRINEELELGSLEHSIVQIIGEPFPARQLDIHARCAQALDIVIDALALRIDAYLLEPHQKVRHRQSVLAVGLTLKHILDI